MAAQLKEVDGVFRTPVPMAWAGTLGGASLTASGLILLRGASEAFSRMPHPTPRAFVGLAFEAALGLYGTKEGLKMLANVAKCFERTSHGLSAASGDVSRTPERA